MAVARISYKAALQSMYHLEPGMLHKSITHTLTPTVCTTMAISWDEMWTITY